MIPFINSLFWQDITIHSKVNMDHCIFSLITLFFSDRLMEDSVVMERLSPYENKLKYQIEKYILVSDLLIFVYTSPCLHWL